jgi:3-deoxy-7-phosphoheptulonate synthase
MTKGWTKSDWRAKPRVQMPDYPDQAALTSSRRSWPNIRRWSLPARRVAEEAAGRRRRGQGLPAAGGDCAESFAEFSADNIRDTFR